MTARMTPLRPGSPTGSAGAPASLRTYPRSAPAVLPSELGSPAAPPPASPPPAAPPPAAPPPAAPPPAARPVVGPLTEATGPPVTESAAPTVRPRPEERRALRASRRRRRRLTVTCALLIAFCLAVTILIVVMAGNRTPGPQVVVAPGVAAAPPGSLPLAPAVRS